MASGLSAGETKPLPTEVGRIGCVILNILKYYVIRHQSACCTEVASSPEATTLVSLA